MFLSNYSYWLGVTGARERSGRQLGDIRNQHIYVIDYVCAKRHKMFDFFFWMIIGQNILD